MFLTAGAVLVLEILSLRLIAPYVGLTLETSTAVIGTALAAIALGAWAGGLAADRYDAARLIGPVLLAAGVLVLLVLPVVRWSGEIYGGTSTTATLVLPMAAVFLPAALLSMVSPMVVKVRLASLDRTGAVVGQLSGIGTMGALVATFATGFVLVAKVPVSVTLLLLGGMVLVLGVASTLGLWRERTALAPVAATSVAALVAGGMMVTAPQPCDVETAYHCVRVSSDVTRASGRTLYLDTLANSYVDLDDPTYLRFRYARALAAAVDAQFPAQEPLRATHIGGGGATMPRWLAATRPGSTSTVLEIDPGVVAVSTQELGLTDGGGIDVQVTDGRSGLAATATDSMDLLVGDAFSGYAVPWHLTTQEALVDVRRVLAADGIYALNVIDYPPAGFARAEIATVASVFDHVALTTYPEALADGVGANFLVLASAEPLPVTAWRDAVRRVVPEWTVIDGAELAEFVGDAVVLTDDFAPVDQLLTVRPNG